MMRIALVSPFPPAQTGISDYVIDFLTGLVNVAEVSCFTDTSSPQIPFDLPVYSLQQYHEKRWEFDATIYQMGNNELHQEIYQLAIQYPAYVCLHDYNLHDFIASTTRDSFGNFIRELSYATGTDGITDGWKIASQLQEHPFENPLNQRLIDSSLGVIVHSEYVAEKLGRDHPQTPCLVIPHVMTVKEDVYPLPLPEDEVLLAVAGKVTPAKQIDFLLRSLAQLDAEHPLHLMLVGTTIEESGLTDLIAELGLENRVTGTGYCATIEEFDRWLASADYLLALRHPTIGETSGGILRALAVGTPSVVFEHGWYAEIPDRLTEKLPVMEQSALTDWLQRCEKTSAEKRTECTQYIQEKCHPQLVASTVVEWLTEQLNRPLSAYE